MMSGLHSSRARRMSANCRRTCPERSRRIVAVTIHDLDLGCAVLAQLRHHVPAQKPRAACHHHAQVVPVFNAIRPGAALHARSPPQVCHASTPVVLPRTPRICTKTFSLPRITQVFTKAFFVSIREIRGESSVLPRITRIFTNYYLFRVNSCNSWRKSLHHPLVLERFGAEIQQDGQPEAGRRQIVERLGFVFRVER